MLEENIEYTSTWLLANRLPKQAGFDVRESRLQMTVRVRQQRVEVELTFLEV